MIYSKDDVKRILDTLLDRIADLMEKTSFAADEFDVVRDEVEKLKKEL